MEEWRPVVGYEGIYEISSHGRLKRVEPGRYYGHIKQPYKYGRNTGHLKHKLKAYGHMERRAVHVLVLEAFHGARPEGAVARHLDGDPTNNKVSNLRWGTHSENEQDKLRHGTHNCARITVEDVRFIRSSDTCDEILAEGMGVTPSIVNGVRTGRRWAWVHDEIVPHDGQ